MIARSAEFCGVGLVAVVHWVVTSLLWISLFRCGATRGTGASTLNHSMSMTSAIQQVKEKARLQG